MEKKLGYKGPCQGIPFYKGGNGKNQENEKLDLYFRDEQLGCHVDAGLGETNLELRQTSLQVDC